MQMTEMLPLRGGVFDHCTSLWGGGNSRKFEPAISTVSCVFFTVHYMVYNKLSCSRDLIGFN